MTYRETMEKFVNEARDLLDMGRHDVLKVFMANYGPQLIDRGIDLDRLYDENERLKRIVNLTELKENHDRLAKRVAELEAERDGKNAMDGSLMR